MSGLSKFSLLPPFYDDAPGTLLTLRSDKPHVHLAPPLLAQPKNVARRASGQLVTHIIAEVLALPRGEAFEISLDVAALDMRPGQ